jgi:tousled-like kinase
LYVADVFPKYFIFNPQKSGYNKRMKPVDVVTYPSVVPFLRSNKSPEGSPTNRASSDEHLSSQDSDQKVVVFPVVEEEGTPPSLTPMVVPKSKRGDDEIDVDEFLRLRGEVIELEQKLCLSQDELQLERERWHKIAEDFSSKLMRASKTITILLEEQARREFIEMRKRLVGDQERLGRFVNVPTQPNGNRGGYWDGGTEDECITASLLQLEQDRADLDREKLATRKMKKANVMVWSNNNSNSTARDSAARVDGAVTMLADNLSSAYPAARPGANSEVEHLLVDTKESIALAEALFKRTEENLRERQKKLHADRIAYMKQLKTYRAQEDSTFNSYRRFGPMERYQLLNMLGKGGFSEVYKAYDLIAHCYVAVKIHEIRKDMDEAQRQNYVKHTTQEYRIHKTLKHRRIVRLLDHFAIDALSFGVAMEYCEGVDLDTYLKAHGPMSEKEARGVIIQILSALRYMNTPPHKVIHYDLKPGNVLYHKGNVKIVDFGLSKIVDHTLTGGHDTIELTSQGAGTFYYLPPECFNACSVVNAGQLKVSNKVDVWSVGVVFFELLFGRKPFGDGQPQEHILRQASTIFNPVAEVVFPGKISKQAEEFIRRLLTYDVRRRPDVIEASDDPYVFPAAARV